MLGSEPCRTVTAGESNLRPFAQSIT